MILTAGLRRSHRSLRLLIVLSLAIEMGPSSYAHSLTAGRPAPTRVSLTAPSDRVASFSPALPDDISRLMAGVPARVVSVRPAAKDGRWAFVIRDLHGHSAAQAGIRRFLETAAKVRPLDILFLEGLAHEWDLAPYRSFPDADLRAMLADFLVSSHRLSGGAAAAMNRSDSIRRVVGIESESLYRNNVEAFREAIDDAGGGRTIAALRTALMRARARTFSSELLAVDAFRWSLERGEASPVDAARFLAARGATLPTPLRSLLAAVRQEERLDQGRILGELRDLTLELSRRGSNAILPFQSAALLDGDAALSSLRDIKAACDASGVAWRRFPALARFKAHLEETASFDAATLADEAREALEGHIAELIETPSERDLLTLSEAAFLRDRLFQRTLTREQWRSLEAGLPPIRSVRPEIRAALRAVFEADRDLSANRRFYEWAVSREGVFTAKMSAEVRAADPMRIAVVAGGFHADVIESSLAALGFGVVSIAPASLAVTREDADLPARALTRPLHPLEKGLTISTLAPRPVHPYAETVYATASYGLARTGDLDDVGQWSRERMSHLRVKPIAASSRVVRDGLKRSEVIVETRSHLRYRLRLEASGSAIVSYVEEPLQRWGVVRPRSWIRRFIRWVRTWLPVDPRVTAFGRALHSGQDVRAEIIRKSEGGIRFVRTDLPRKEVDPETGHLRHPTVAAVIENALPGRQKYTGISANGKDEVRTVEHILVALDRMGIYDAEIRVNGDEVPILDGAAESWMEILRPLTNTGRERPFWRRIMRDDSHRRSADWRLEVPLVLRRDRNTAVILLPRDGDQRGIRVTAFPNLPTLPAGVYEASYEFAGPDDFEREIAPHQTFVALPLRRLQRDQGIFHGGVDRGPWRNVTRAYPDPADPEQTTKLNDPVEFEEFRLQLASHKILDFLGDLVLLKQSYRLKTGEYPEFVANVYIIGTGHRDHNDASKFWRSYYNHGIAHPVPFGLIDETLSHQRKIKRLSESAFRDISRRLDERFWMSVGTEVERITRSVETLPGPVLDALTVKRTDSKTRWRYDVEANDFLVPLEPSLNYVGDVVEDYLGLADRAADRGRTLRYLAGKLLSSDFPIAELRSVEYAVWEERERELVIRVTLQAGDKRRRVSFALVMSKYQNDRRLYEARKNMQVAAEIVDPNAPRVALFKMISLPNSGPAALFAKEWTEKTPRFVPKASVKELRAYKLNRDANPTIEFGRWTASSRRVKAEEMSAEEKLRVAAAYGRMMGTYFTRFYKRRADEPIAASVDEDQGGWIPIDIDFHSDLHYVLSDDGDGAYLNHIRGYRYVAPERFLYDLLHTRVSVTNSAGDEILQKEWQIFAVTTPEGHHDRRYLAAVLDGATEAFIDFYGEEKGLEVMADISRRYMDIVTRHSVHSSLAEHLKNVPRTWAYKVRRLSSLSDRVGTELKEHSIEGPSAVDVVVSHIERIHDRLEDLDAGPYRPVASARWLSGSLSALFGGSDLAWSRRAPATELALPMMASLLAVESVAGPHRLAAVLIVSGLAWVWWAASHRTVLMVESEDVRWVSWRDVAEDVKAARRFRAARRAVWRLGFVTMVLPVWAFASGSPGLSAVVAAAAGYAHLRFNPSIPSIRAGERNADSGSRWRRSRRFLSAA